MNIIGDKIEFIDEMLSKNPMDSYLRYAMAQELLLTGKEAEGMTMLEGITKDDKEFVYAYYPLGKLYREKGKKSKAVKNFQKGLIMARKQNMVEIEGQIAEALMIMDVYDHAPY